MRRYSKPIDQMILEAMKSLGREGFIQQITDWIRLQYPEDAVNPSTIGTTMADLDVPKPKWVQVHILRSISRFS
jgi:hypothetical protein